MSSPSQSSHPSVPASPDGSAPRGDEALFALVYEELRQVAHRRLVSERAGHTLSTTALVHEVWLRMASARRGMAPGNREQFFALAARAMRRILVDYARRHRALKRPPDQQRVSFTTLEAEGAGTAGPATAAEQAELLLAIDDALDELRGLDERLARVVELRFFIGLTESETASALGVTARTVARDWVKARGWLRARLADRADT